MQAANFLLLALMQGAAATAGIEIVNPYTDWLQPPPDCVACSSNDDCQSSCNNAYCQDTARISGNCPLNWCVEEDHAPEAVVCDNPKANGFIKCEDGTLYRHCSPSNRDGGMYYTTEIPPPHSPPAPPAPPQPPPDFATSTEGQLLFGACALIFILIVGTVRFSLGLSLLAHLPACHANRWINGASRAWQMAYLFHVRWKMDSDQLKKSAADESKDIIGLMRKGRAQAVRSTSL